MIYYFLIIFDATSPTRRGDGQDTASQDYIEL